MIPLVGAALATGAGSLLGGVANAIGNIISTNHTNHTNQDINEQQLVAQKEYWKQQQQNWLQERRWSLEDRAYENAYNSPASLKARYLAAGINPYLAMQGQSSPASVQAVSPSAPNAPNVPSSIPMQTPDVSGFGIGISQASSLAMQYQANEREDYRLASDITSNHMNAYANVLNALSKMKDVNISERWIQKQIENLDREYYLNQDRFAVANESFQFNSWLEQERLRLQDAELIIKEESLKNDIRLSYSQIAQISQMISESRQRVDNLAAEQDISYKDYQIRLRRDLFDMRARLLEIGISEEMMKSDKFKAFFGSIANALIGGAGVYFGMRGLGSVVGKKALRGSSKSYNGPFKTYDYDPIKDTPWNSW